MKILVKIIPLIIVIVLILSLWVIGVMRTKKPFYYSINKKEAINNDTYISTYNLIAKDGSFISEGVLVYALKKEMLYNKIELNKTQLSIRPPLHFEEKHVNEKEIYWEAFFKDKKLTAFENKSLVSVIGVEKYMDTILLKPNQKEVFYIVKIK